MSNGKATRAGRRRFLGWLIGLALSLGLPGLARAFWVHQLGVRTVEKKNFGFDPKTGLLSRAGRSSRPYELKVGGLAEEHFSLSYQDILALPAVDQVSDFHCVEGWSVRDLKWRGFRFSELVKRAKPFPGAKYVVFHSLGQTSYQPKGQTHYLESFPLAQLLDPRREIMLAYQLMGKPLPPHHGAPLRVVAPFDLGYKSIKFVERVEFSLKPRPGWWTLANPVYPIDAPVSSQRLRRKPGQGKGGAS